MSDHTRASSIQRKPRPALGIVTHQVAGASAWWLGAAEVACRQNVDLFVFHASNVGEAGATLGDDASALHHLIGPERLDSLLLAQWWPSQQFFEEFYHRYYHPLPVVNLHRHYEGYPGVSVDSYTGMLTAIRHLIAEHGYRRLAFIAGPPHNPSAEARYAAYVAALAEYAIPLDPALVVPGDFSAPAGRRAVQVLLDERGLRPAVDFEAIIAANDYMALTALEELQNRAIRVPLDVALVGFDDYMDARYRMPALTTVRMPNEEMGRVGAAMALAAMHGEPVADVTVPAELVVRQSCGCFLSPLLAVAPTPTSPTESSVSMAEQRAIAIEALQQAIAPAGEILPSAWLAQLLDAFAAGLESASTPATLGHLFSVLHAILRQFHTHGYDLVTVGRTLLLTLRDVMRPLVFEAPMRQRAENQWQQAMAFVADIGQQADAAQLHYRGDFLAQVRSIGERLVTTFDLDRLLDLFARELSSLHIPSCYIALYEDADTARQQARLIFAYAQGQRDPLALEGRRYHARQLLPDEGLSAIHPSVFVVTALYFQEKPLGFALFEVGPEQDEVYETLSRQLSSALMGSLLLQQQKQTQREVDLARQQAQTALSDMVTTRAIADRVRQAPDTEAILRVALESLRDALGATTAVVRLGTREQLREAAEHARPAAELDEG